VGSNPTLITKQYHDLLKKKNASFFFLYFYPFYCSFNFKPVSAKEVRTPDWSCCH